MSSGPDMLNIIIQKVYRVPPPPPPPPSCHYCYRFMEEEEVKRNCNTCTLHIHYGCPFIIILVLFSVNPGGQ